MKRQRFRTFWVGLLLIGLLAGWLRFWKIDSIPVHLGNDEISIAYDSYSMRLTGKDEYGIVWPMSFKSHRDYKAPLYAYLNMPLNYLWGNTELGVRGLSAIAGLLTVIFIALMGKAMGGNKLGLLSALLMAICPKAIYVSRMAYEANLAAFLFLVGVFGIWRYLRRNNVRWLWISGLVFGFSIWAYHTEKGLVPLFIALVGLIERKRINLRHWLGLALIVGIVISPVLYDFMTVQRVDPYNRASSQIWFKSGTVIGILESHDSWWKKAAAVISDPVGRYLEHFSGKFLFGDGLGILPRFEPLNQGWFLMMTLPLLIWGLKVLIGKDFRLRNFLIGWWLICPIIPSLTSGEVAAVRNLTMLAPTILIMGTGAVNIWERSRKIFVILAILVGINFVYFWTAYYVHFPRISGDDFQYGYKQAWVTIKPDVDRAEKIVVETRFGSYGMFVGLPRLYFGYFAKFDPTWLQKREETKGALGKYEMREVDWFRETLTPKTIYVVSKINPIPAMYLDKVELRETIRKGDGQEQFLIYYSK